MRFDRSVIWAVAVAVISAIAFGLLVVLMQVFPGFGPPAYPYPHEETYGTGALMILFSVAITAWGISVFHRCNDAAIRRNLMGILALLYVWVLAALFKSMAQDDFAESLAWYSYYVPNVFVPMLCLFNAFRSSRLERKPWVRALKRVLTVAGLALLALVYTNNLHQLAFRFSWADPAWDTNYGYGPVYWVVFAWAAGVLLAAYLVAAAASRPNLRSTIFTLMVIALMGAAYALLYALRLDFFVQTNVALVFTVVVMALLEVCLQVGIIPSFRHFGELFRKLPFDLKLLVEDRELVFRSVITTDTARVERPEERGMLMALDLDETDGVATFKLPRYPDALYKAYPIRGGVALLTEDASTVNAESMRLAVRKQELERQVQLLEQDHTIRHRLYRQLRERELYESVEDSLRTSTEHIRDLLEAMPASTTPQERAARRKQLVLVKLVLAYCKRKGSLVLAKKSNADFDRDRLMLVVNEMLADVRVSGIECAAIVEVEQVIPAAAVNALYDALYGFTTIAIWRVNPVLMIFVRGAGESIEVRMSMECDDEGDLEALPDVQRYRSTLDELDLSYEFEAEHGALKLTARVSTVEDAGGED